MRRCVLAIAAWLAAFPATAQEVPKPTAEGKAALEKLVGLCVEAGGLKREPLPGGKGERLVVVDAPKVDVAVVKAANGLPVRPLCDAMVARIGDCDPAELGTYMGLVKCLAEKTGDRRTVAFAVFYESWENGVGGRSKEAAAGRPPPRPPPPGRTPSPPPPPTSRA